MAKLSRFEIEKRVLYGTSIATSVGVVIFLIALSLDHWVSLDVDGGQYRNKTESYLMGHYSGLWRICRTELHNKTQPHHYRTYCNMIQFFPDKKQLADDPEVNKAILDYSRTETAFAVIGLLMMFLAHVFAFYSLYEPRYMFKRLAGVLHLLTAICLLVCVEVMTNSVHYERKNLYKRHPRGSSFSYDYCFYLAWIVFVVMLLAGIIFLFLSKKRKGDEAGSDREAIENEPVNIGRL